jgi:Amt family ammonium transporter
MLSALPHTHPRYTTGAAVAFYLVGFGLAFGGSDPDGPVTFVGSDNFVGRGEIDMGFWFFQFAFSATAVTIVAGTLAERCKMTAYFSYSMFLTGFVYPVIVHAVWSSNGFLSAFSRDPLGGIGVIDFAGSGVVHVTGGMTALIATMILGPRRGRFYDDDGNVLDEPVAFKGQSMALQLLGTLVLWFGCTYSGLGINTRYSGSWNPSLMPFSLFGIHRVRFQRRFGFVADCC